MLMQVLLPCAVVFGSVEDCFHLIYVHALMLMQVLLPCAVVFGQVVEGMDIVRAIEAVGSSSGKPSQQVTIADAGEVSA